MDGLFNLTNVGKHPPGTRCQGAAPGFGQVEVTTEPHSVSAGHYVDSPRSQGRVSAALTEEVPLIPAGPMGAVPASEECLGVRPLPPSGGP